MFERYRDMQERRNAGDAPEYGFTLIELLIVIIVLGILAAIVIFSLTGVTGQSKQAACNSDAKTVETAVSAYQAEIGSFPQAGAAGFTQLTSSATAHGPYLRSTPSATVPSSGYAITLAGGGVVNVTNGTTTTNYDSGGAALCNALS